MKAFAISLCIFLLAVSFSVYAACRTNSVCRALLDAIPSDGEAADPAAFEAIWAKKRPFLRYTVGHTESDYVDDALDEWRARYEEGSDSDRRAAIQKLSSAIEKIRCGESLSFDTLF